MKPATPVVAGLEAIETVFGKGQPGVAPLPALISVAGVVVSRWELSEEELKRIAETRSIYLYVHTHGAPLQPVLVDTEGPF